MANFTEIGVTAVVEGMRKFNADLDKMNDTMLDTSDQVENLADAITRELKIGTDVLARDIQEINFTIQELGDRIVAVNRKALDPMGEKTESAGKEAKTMGERLPVKKVETFGQKLTRITNTLANVGSFLLDAGRAAFAFGEKIFDVGIGTVETAISFESAFAGVIKTTEGLTDETGNLTESGKELQAQFRGLAKNVPVAVEELLEIGELGGQLGIAKEDLIGFTETITAMGVATNLTTEDAATQFAQIANIMGTVEREGADAFSKLGSSIVALGNNFATTEADIANFASRIAGAGAIAGLTEADVFGIGAAFSSVGVEAEAGGTAVQKVLLGINKSVTTGGHQLETFASVAGLTVEDFSKLWEEDAGDAFTKFVEGLGAAGDDAIFILEDLELKDQRLVKAFLSLAGAGDLLNETLTLSSDAWDENTALAKEAEQRYATTESQIEIAKNALKDFGITIGGAVLPFVNDMLQVLKPIIDALGERLPGLLENSVIPAFKSVVDVIKPWVQWIGFAIADGDLLNDFLTELPLFIQDAVKAFSGIGNEGGGIFQNLIPDTGFISEAIGVIVQVIQTLPDILQNQVLPVLQTFGQWFMQFLPVAVTFFVDLWQNLFLPQILAWVEVWNSNLQPALALLWAWLQERVPQAIEALSNLWTNTLSPVIAEWGTFLSETLIPIIGQLVQWLIENLPTAIDTVATFWTTTLQPALAQVWNFIITSLIPAISDIFTWLQDNIPSAIETSSSFWEETLKPAIEAVWKFVTEFLIPIFTSVVEWLQTTIPAAIEIAKQFWEETLKPAIEAIWDFIVTNLIPIFEILEIWLATNLPVAIEELRKWFDEFLKPALEATWKFIDENLIPLFKALGELIGVALTVVIQGWTELWNLHVKPALEAVWKVIKEKVIPVLQSLWTFIVEKAIPILDKLREASLDRIKESFNNIAAAIQNMINWVNAAIDKLKKLKAPGDFEPGSPPPLFFALQDISTAMRQLSNVDVPRLAASMSMLNAASMSAPATMSAGMVAGRTVNQNIGFNTTINNGMDQAIFENRVLDVVGTAIGV